MTCAAILYKNRTTNFRILYLPTIIGLVSCIQLLFTLLEKNSFTPDLFGSVGEGGQSIVYTGFILSFPIFGLLLKYNISIKPCKDSVDVIFKPTPTFSNEEILAYISYGALATYTISFMGSPQHYAGFLILTFLSIFIVIKNSGSRILNCLLLISILLIPPLNSGYLDTGKEFIIEKSDYFNYLQKLGHHIYFRSPINVSKIAEEYNILASKYSPTGKIYLISKDKSYLELFLDQNIQPKSYDIFANFVNITGENALLKLKKDKVNFVILESSIHRDSIVNLIELERDYLGQTEYNFHRQILFNINSLEKLLNQNLIECSTRYCIYKVPTT